MTESHVPRIYGIKFGGSKRGVSGRAVVQVLRLPQVCRMTGLCRSMVYQMQTERRFPQAIKIGVRAVGWVESEVQDWLVKRVESSRRSVSDSK
jgi:prophage regulatory protein